MSVKHGCICVDELEAIPKAIKDAALEHTRSNHPGSSAMPSVAQNICEPISTVAY